MGTIFAGIAIGPAIGSLSIQITKNPLTPFYLAFSIHFLQFLINFLIMPESLSIEKQLIAKKKYNDKKEEKFKNAKRNDFDNLDREGRSSSAFKKIWIGTKNFVRPVATIFEPLALLGPRKRDSGGLDWSLPILAITTGLYSMMMVSRYSV